MTDTDIIEILCKMQDMNKQLRFNAESQEQIQQCEVVESNIQNKFKNLYVN